MVGRASSPSLCEVVIRPNIKGKRAELWRGVIRVPEYRSHRSIVEVAIEDEALARELDVMSTKLGVGLTCVPRRYW